MEGQPHPYAPTDLKIPGYAPNFLTQSTIVSVYGLSFLLVVSPIWILSELTEFYKDKTAHYLAEVWKEYSKGDSRYAARDAATVTVEGVTAVVEGPDSLLAVYAIASGKSYSYILQLAVSLGQLYGTAVYFLTACLEDLLGSPNSGPEKDQKSLRFMPKGSFLSCGVERDHNSSVKKKAKHTMDSISLELKVISCRDHNSSVKKKAKHTMGSISLELKVISCRDLKVFNFFQKLSVYVAVSIFIDEPRKNEKQRQKRVVDFLSRLLKKNEKQLQRLQRKKTRLNDEEQKNEQQQLLQLQKTPVDREGGSNPEWNHMMQFDLNTTTLPGHGDHHLFFKFELRSEGAIFGNKAIGEVRVPFKDLNEGFNGSVRIVNYHVRNSDEEPIGVLSFSYEVKEKIKRIDTPKADWAPGIRSPSPKNLVLHP